MLAPPSSRNAVDVSTEKGITRERDGNDRITTLKPNPPCLPTTRQLQVQQQRELCTQEEHFKSLKQPTSLASDGHNVKSSRVQHTHPARQWHQQLQSQCPAGWWRRLWGRPAGHSTLPAGSATVHTSGPCKHLHGETECHQCLGFPFLPGITPMTLTRLEDVL